MQTNRILGIRHCKAVLAIFCAFLLDAANFARGADPVVDQSVGSVLTTQEQLVDQVQERVVKLCGAGGARGLES